MSRFSKDYPSNVSHHVSQWLVSNAKNKSVWLIASFILLALSIALLSSPTRALAGKRLLREAWTTVTSVTKLEKLAGITTSTSKLSAASNLIAVAAKNPILGTAKLNIARQGHAAITLSDGKILIVGGENANGLIKESEIYNPATRQFMVADSSITARTEPTATSLPDGRILIAGGRGQAQALRTTEIYDYGRNVFTQGPALNRPRAGHSATKLTDGRILIAGGSADGSAEIFDPATQTFSLVSGGLNTARSLHTAVLLKTGKVLLAGGKLTNGKALNSAELFDPATQQFTTLKSTMRGARISPALKLLRDGKVQVIGGGEETMEMYNAEGNYFTAYAHLTNNAATLSTSGRAAFIHRKNAKAVTKREAQTESFATAAVATTEADPIDPLLDRDAATSTDTGTTTVVAGGVDSTDTTLSSAIEMVSYAASVTTDKTDYMPGDVATITGTGFLPNQTVNLLLERDTTPPTTMTWTAQTDGAGNFTTTYNVVETDLGVTFVLTATGQPDGPVAQTTFTDNKNIEITFAGSGSGTVTVINTTPNPDVTTTCTGTPNPCIVVTDNNDVGTLTATAAPGSVFIGWSGPPSAGLSGCTGTTSPCNFSMGNAGQSITATFTAANKLGTVTVGAQTGTITYGTGGSVNFLVTVNRSTGAGAFNANLTIGSLPAGATGSFSPNPVVFTAGDNSKTSTLTITTTSAALPITASSFTVTATNTVVSADNASGNGSLTIGKKIITPSITANNKPYDGNTSATIASRSLTGVLAGDTGNVTLTGGTATFADANVGTNKTVMATGLSLTGTAAVNYQLSSTTATTTANITALAITGSFTAQSKTYDGATTATVLTRSLSGVLAGDTANVSLTGGTASFADANVGTGKTVTLTGATLTGSASGNYSLTSVSTTTANITALAITGSFTASNKIYDGTATATVTNRTLAGVLAGDTGNVSLTGGTATFTDKNVANGKTVTLSGASLTGSAAGNYSLTSVATTTANITALSITGSITAADKTYDRTTAATITGRSLTGVLGGDTVSYAGGTATFADKNVGNGKIVTATGLSLSGADAGNYSVNITATTTANITAATVTPSITASNKTYDGNNTATIASRSLTGVIAPEVVSLTGGTATFADQNVGSGKTVTATGLSLSGADASNYSLSSTSAVTTADITTLSITGSFTAQSKVYDSTTAATVNSRSVSGVLAGDSGNVNLTGGTATFADANVGTGKIVTLTGSTLSGTAAGNYSLTSVSTTTADITALGITGSFTAQNKVYDGNASATVLTRSLSGVLAGDTANVNLAGGTASFANANVGTGKVVTLTGSTLSGSAAGNYNLTSVSTTTANITKAAATIIVTPYSVTYDGVSHTATGTATGVLSESLSGLNLSGTTHTNVGTYATDAWTFTDVTGNYNDASGTVSDVIGKANATINVTGYTGVYDGAAHGATGTATGVLSEALSGLSLGASFTNVPGGTANWTFTDVTGNYNNTSGTATITINKATASVTPNVGSKTYGDADPALTGSLSGFVLNDNVTASYNRTAGETVGTYTISAILSPVGVLGNYNITYNTALFIINKKDAAVTPNGGSKTYGDADPAFTGSLSGFLASDGVSATYTRTAGESVAGNPYTISASLSPAAVLGNYNITYNTASFIINQRTASVTPNGGSKTYGDVDPVFTGSLSGFVIGDGVTASYSRTPGETVNTYIITATLSPSGVLGNYNITYNTASFVINKKPASVSPDSANKIYGSADPAFTGTLSGFLGGDGVTASYSRTSGQTVGTYLISATLSPIGVLGNYNITYNTALFTINKQTASVTPDATSKIYGSADPAFSGTLTGFLPGDSVTASYSRTAGETVAGSPYTISATLSPMGVLGNYDITYNTASFTINKKTASVTPDAKSKVYGASDPVLTGTTSDFLGGDSVTASYSRTAGETVAGSPYTISATLSPSGVLGNYDITYNTANFTIKARDITVTATNKTKVYGDADLALTFTLGGSGLASGDTQAGVFSGALTRAIGETVGSYAITQGTLVVNSNYNLTTFTPATLTITKKVASVTPNAASKYYGAADPALSGTLTGFLAGDSITATYGRTVGEAVGTYTISAGLSPAGVLGNYNITYNTAVFTINTRPTMIAYTGASTSQYGTCIVNVSATLKDGLTSAFINTSQTITITVGGKSVNLTSSNGTFTGTIVTDNTMNVGTYNITANFAGNLANGLAASSQSLTNGFSITAGSVGPYNGQAVYTGLNFFWTTGPSSSTATLTLSTTLKDTTAPCQGDIRTARVTFATRNADGTYSPLPNAQNLPVGLVNPADPTTGTAQAISQYNLGNQNFASIQIAVIVTGNYTRNQSADDTIVGIAKPGVANQMIGVGTLNNLALPKTSNGFLGNAPAAGANYFTSISSNVTYNKSFTNPQGKVNLIVKSLNKSDGTVDTAVHTYSITSNSISTFTSATVSGQVVVTFGAKCNVVEITNPATPIALEGGAQMQIVMSPPGGTTNPQSASITVQKNGGGLWYSSAWDGGKTVAKALASGTITVQ